MDYTYKQLEQELSALTKLFAELGTRLSEVAKEVAAPGVMPSEKLLEQISASRTTFDNVRTAVHSHAGAMLVSPLPKLGELVSIATIESLLKASAVAEQTKLSIEREREQALAILGRVLSITHREGDFKPLQDCHAKIGELRSAVSNVLWPHRHPESESIVGSNHPVTSLLQFVENLDQLDDERWMALEARITESYGKPLFVAASRGKLVVKSDAKPAPSAEKPVEKPVAEKVPEKPAAQPTSAPAAQPTAAPAAQPTAAPAAPPASAEKKVPTPPAPAAPVGAAPAVSVPSPATPVPAAAVAPAASEKTSQKPTTAAQAPPAPPEKKAVQPVSAPPSATAPAPPAPATPSPSPAPVAATPAAPPRPPAPAVAPSAPPATPAHAPVAASPAPAVPPAQVTPQAPAAPAAASNNNPPASPLTVTMNSLTALANATEPAEKKPAHADTADKQRKEPRLAAPAPQPPAKPEPKPQEIPEPAQQGMAGDGSQRPQRWGFWRGNR